PEAPEAPEAAPDSKKDSTVRIKRRLSLFLSALLCHHYWRSRDYLSMPREGQRRAREGDLLAVEERGMDKERRDEEI
ncbi:hypothetical protein PMAYCL1PPCAC_01307, partial [Pristionchus mayeri]